MQKKKFNESQIVAAIKKQEAGVAVKEICRELGISDATFYNWKAKYGGMQASDITKMRDLEKAIIVLSYKMQLIMKMKVHILLF